jgi:hypothetical protein
MDEYLCIHWIEMNKTYMILNKIEKDHSQWLIEIASEPKMALLIFMSCFVWHNNYMDLLKKITMM